MVRERETAKNGLRGSNSSCLVDFFHLAHLFIDESDKHFTAGRGEGGGGGVTPPETINHPLTPLPSHTKRVNYSGGGRGWSQVVIKFFSFGAVGFNINIIPKRKQDSFNCQFIQQFS